MYSRITTDRVIYKRSVIVIKQKFEQQTGQPVRQSPLGILVSVLFVVYFFVVATAARIKCPVLFPSLRGGAS
jgi:hypothetical protein